MGARRIAPDSPHRGAAMVLMYHSISHGPGPTCIPRATFRAHLDMLVSGGYHVVPLTTLAAWHRGDIELPDRAAVITFDDGFLDFVEAGFPELSALGLTATVFLPTGRIGLTEDWTGHLAAAPRELMTWSHVKELAHRDIHFGAHTVSHTDLTVLTPERLEHELQSSREHIRHHLGQPPASFAPPYGKSNPTVRRAIRACFQLSVGVQLQLADRGCDLFDIPRIEMHYFRDLRHWRAFLDGRMTYFNTRRLVRRVRSSIFGRGW